MTPSPFDQLRDAALHAFVDLRVAGKVLRRGRVIKAAQLCLRARQRLEKVLQKEDSNGPAR